MAGPKNPSEAVYELTDPITGNARRDRRSPLKRAIDRVDQASLQNVVACPFGCKAADQDRMGYCRHLVGFVNSETFKDGEVKNPPADAVVETVATDPDEHNRRPVVGRGKLRNGDYLLRITSSLRVYRNDGDGPASREEPEYEEEPKPARKPKPKTRRGQTTVRAASQRRVEEPEMAEEALS